MVPLDHRNRLDAMETISPRLRQETEGSAQESPPRFVNPASARLADEIPSGWPSDRGGCTGTIEWLLRGPA